jgi:hypothetical protein
MMRPDASAEATNLVLHNLSGVYGFVFDVRSAQPNLHVSREVTACSWATFASRTFVISVVIIIKPPLCFPMTSVESHKHLFKLLQNNIAQS